MDVKKLREIIELGRVELSENIAPFRTLRMVGDSFSIRADPHTETDARTAMHRSWHYKLAAEAKRDKAGLNYWTKKYEASLAMHRSAIKAKNFNEGDDEDRDEDGYLPPHRR
jgi:hypothetical protein